MHCQQTAEHWNIYFLWYNDHKKFWALLKPVYHDFGYFRMFLKGRLDSHPTIHQKICLIRSKILLQKWVIKSRGDVERLVYWDFFSNFNNVSEFLVQYKIFRTLKFYLTSLQLKVLQQSKGAKSPNSPGSLSVVAEVDII